MFYIKLYLFYINLSASVISMSIQINIDVQMAKKKVSLTQLSEGVGISMTNLSLLKTGKVKGIRFATLSKICNVLDCQPGDILEYISEQDS